MKHLYAIFFFLLILMLQNLTATPVTTHKRLCKLPAHGANVQNNINKRIRKTPLHYLRLTNGCQHTKSLYVALKPSGGPFSGHDIEMVVVDGTVFRRFRLCDSCPFSPWHPVDNAPHTDKIHKQHGFLVCPDGSIQFTGGEHN